jgi:hypothetical protein
MSGRSWLDGLKEMLKEKVPAINVPRRVFGTPTPAKGAKGAKAPLDALLHLLHLRQCTDIEKSRSKENGLHYER